MRSTVVPWTGAVTGTERSDVTIRAATGADASAIAGIYRPYVESTVVSFETQPPDAETIRARMDRSPRFPWLVAQRSGPDGERVVGYAYGSPHRDRAAYRWAADVTVYLAPAARRQGVGTGLYRALFGELKELGYTSLYAGITLPNAASVGLHESLGFRVVGVYDNVGYKDGAWRSVGWWQLPLCLPDELPVQPDDPRPWNGRLA